MATSWTLTREKFATGVLRKLRVVGESETPSADQFSTVFEALDARLKSLHSLGLLWWKVTNTAVDLNLTASVSSVALPADFLTPVSIKLRDTEDLPVEILSHYEYQAIPDKTDTGVPDRVYFGVSSAYFYPTPQSNYTAKLTYQKIVDDSAANTAPDIIVAGLRCLKTIIAHDCADDFYVPEERIVRMALEAASAETELRVLMAPQTDNQVTQVDFY